jgi:high-affinity iron transporter
MNGRAHWVLAAWFVIAIALVPQPGAYAAQPDASAQLVVHLLDYISVDYPTFVKVGKVTDASEYKEQQEFATQVVTLLGQLPEVRERTELLSEASRLKRRIDARAPGEEVSKAATDLRWRVIGAYGIAVVPKRPPDLQLGARLYSSQCAGCHGASGHGDGVLAKGLDPAPADFHDHDRVAQRSVYGFYNSITLGVTGTAMKSFSELPEEDRWALAFHVAALGADPARTAAAEQLWKGGHGKTEAGNLRALATLTENDVARRYGEDVATVFVWLRAHPATLESAQSSPIAYARSVLGESLAAYRAGRREEAQRLALGAYLEGFELAEATLDTVDRNLRQEVETQMLGYRELLRQNAPPAQVASAAERIDQLLEASDRALGHESLTASTAAMSAFFIIVREGLEALLVITAIVAFLIRTGRRDALLWIHAGWIGALALGLVTWFAALSLVRVSGATRELTEGFTALFAAGILLYVGFWLHAKSHAAAWKTFVQEHVQGALQRGTLWALAGVSFLAVYREAFETVLFIQALWQQSADEAQHAVAAGLGCGAAVLALIAWLMLRFGVRLPLGPFFTVCSLLMAVLAVVFTGQGIKALQEADVIAASPVTTFSVSALGFYPTVQTIVGQAAVLALVIAMFLWSGHRGARSAAT